MTNQLAIVREGGAYTAMAPVSNLERKNIYNAVSSPDYRLRECANMVIPVVAIIVEPVEIKREVTSPGGQRMGEEIVTCPRTVLIDAEGKSYTATSNGVYNSVSRIVAMFGDPSTWTEPLNVRPKLITRGQNNIVTLEIV